jgi:hypothetical protein
VAGWDPEPVWTQGLEEKSSASVGDQTSVVQSVVRHYTERAKNDSRGKSGTTQTYIGGVQNEFGFINAEGFSFV